MKIYYLSPNPKLRPENQKKLEKVGKFVPIQIKGAEEQKITGKIKEAEILLVSPTAISKITKTFFNSMPNLKHLALLSSGHDWVDVESANKHRVSISHCAGANSESVAEHTWGLILGLSKRITEQDRDLHIHRKSVSKQYEGIELKGKILGILGVGNVGSLVAKIGKSLGMTILGYSRNRRAEESCNQITNITTLLKQSDIISIHLPLNNETQNLVDFKKLKLVKKNVIIVNTAREKIVNKNAILQALKEKRVFGYGVDVEKTGPNDPYYQYANVIINKHNAFNTKEAKQRMQNCAIKNTEAFVLGKPINLIKKI